MSLGLKTKSGYIYVGMFFNCNEFAIKTKRDGSQYIRCTAKTSKPEHICSLCNLINPHNKPIHSK